MKHPSLLAGFLCLGLAAVVGAAYVLQDDGADTSAGQVVAPPTDESAVAFKTLSPHAERLKGKLEAAKREIELAKEVGTEVEGGMIRVKDVDGAPLYIYPKLIKGMGRFGEEKYLVAKARATPAVPIKKVPMPKDSGTVKIGNKQLKVHTLNPDKPPKSAGGGAGGSDADQGAGGGTSGSGAGEKPAGGG